MYSSGEIAGYYAYALYTLLANYRVAALIALVTSDRILSRGNKI